MTVFIINSIGLGPGLVTWGTAALVIGWLTGFFGLFGLPSEQPCLGNPGLNVLGLFLSVLALIDSTLIRKQAATADGLAEPCCTESGEARAGTTCGEQLPADSLTAAASKGSQRTKGIMCAILAGCCYGANFLPSTWIQDHVAGASKDGLDYVFNQFCGILASSAVYFLVYCIVMRNKPVVNPEIALPGFVSGVMWAIAQTGWFVANVDIGYSAAFPLIVIGPGFVGSLWSVFLFKDITGRRNYLLLAGYFTLAVAACACIVLSRKTTPECQR